MVVVNGKSLSIFTFTLTANGTAAILLVSHRK